TGEIVEILTSTTSKGPNMSWLNFAKSNQARSKIKQWFKRIRREENIEKGKDLVEKEAKKQSINFMDIAKGERYDKLIKKYNFNSLEDIFASIGAGIMSANGVISKLKGEVVEVQSQEKTQTEIEEQIAKTERTTKSKVSNTSGVSVKGLNNLMVRFAKCCNPVPGDDIVGYVTKGRGISVHRSDCSNFKHIVEVRNEKVVEVSWNSVSGENYEAEIEIKAEDSSGYLSEVMMVVSDLKVNLTALNAKTTKTNFVHINMKVKVDSLDKLRELMRKFRKIKGTRDVYRVKN
ncbi:MAG: ACT domain-containing protein, partial [Sarcina sp.]